MTLVFISACVLSFRTVALHAFAVLVPGLLPGCCSA